MKYYVNTQGAYLGGWDTNPPAGAIEVPFPPADARQVWDFGAKSWGPIPVSPSDVDAERDRRLLRFKFRGVWYQSRPEDRLRIAGAHSSALACMMTGTPWPEDFEWIAEDDSRVPMTAADVLAFGAAAVTHEKDHIFACSSLKMMKPIPVDFKDDKWWP